MAPVQNGSILGGDTVDKLVGMIFSPGRKNSSESSLSLSLSLGVVCAIIDRRKGKLCAKEVVEEVLDRWKGFELFFHSL